MIPATRLTLRTAAFQQAKRSLTRSNLLPVMSKINLSGSATVTNIIKPLQMRQIHTSRVSLESSGSSTDGSHIPESVRNLKLEDYHEFADETLELIYCDLDEFFADNNLVNADVEESSGILQINFPGGSYVLNKQPPNKQLWLSSPVSGPKRFDYLDGEWVSLRDNLKLYDILQVEVDDFVKQEKEDLQFQFSNPF